MDRYRDQPPGTGSRHGFQPNLVRHLPGLSGAGGARTQGRGVDIPGAGDRLHPAFHRLPVRRRRHRLHVPVVRGPGDRDATLGRSGRRGAVAAGGRSAELARSSWPDRAAAQARSPASPRRQFAAHCGCAGIRERVHGLVGVRDDVRRGACGLGGRAGPGPAGVGLPHLHSDSGRALSDPGVELEPLASDGRLDHPRVRPGGASRLPQAGDHRSGGRRGAVHRIGHQGLRGSRLFVVLDQAGTISWLRALR